MSACKLCGAPLGSDDIGATLRFVNRGAQEYYCLVCLCQRLGCDMEFLRERIAFLKRNGCTAFPDSVKP